jgi:CelD/BcsL family acetyltransferase involved in cellulose biosynthesis
MMPGVRTGEETGRFVAEMTSLSAFAAERAAWARLAREAIEPNPFYEPGFLLASSRHLETPEAIRLMVVRDGLHDNRPVGLVPLSRPQLRDGLLFGAESLYRNPYSSLTTPLIHADCAGAVLEAAFSLLGRRGAGGDVLHLPLISLNRPFAGALAAHCAARGLPWRIGHRHERAAIDFTDPQEHTPPHRAKPLLRSLARRLRRLEEQGTVTFSALDGESAEGRQALEAFLALEQRGWKGRRGTALASRPHSLAFVRAALEGGTNGPAFLIECLRVDDRPIALNINLVAQGTAYTIKTTYDEAYAAFSPGVLLDWNTIRLGTTENSILRVDSCADPGHRIEALWPGRESIGALIVGVRADIPPRRLDRMETGMRWMTQLIAGAKALRGRMRPVA